MLGWKCYLVPTAVSGSALIVIEIPTYEVVLLGMFGMVPRHSSLYVVHCMLGVGPGKLGPGEGCMVVAVEGCSWRLKI